MPRNLKRALASLMSITLLVLTSFPPSPIAAAGSGRRILFYHPDHLGSSHMITDGTGQVVALAEHTPYGSLQRHEGPVRVPQQFTGQRRDETTGLYFYTTRYYDPSLGRFTQPDALVQAPADPQTLNRYSYVRNNPVVFIDPSGHSFWKSFKRVYLALVTFGMSETIPLTTQALVNLSESAGVDPRYTLAAYSALLGALTGGIGSGLGAAISGGVTSFGTSLAMDSGTGRKVTRKVAKEFFMDVVGMSPQAAYTAAAITISTGVSIAISSASQAARGIYKGIAHADVTWQRGGPDIPKARYQVAVPENNNFGLSTLNINPELELNAKSVAMWLFHQVAEENGIVSKTLNYTRVIPNAFATAHDNGMLAIRQASGFLAPVTVSALNFPTMPPVLALTYGALLPQTNTIAISSYAASAGERED